MVGMKKNISFWINDNNCWVCTSHALDKDGYVRFYANKETKLHRVIYSLNYGRIPKGKVVMHICDNPSCINPCHLKLGTPSDNNDDKIKKGRGARGININTVKLNPIQVKKIYLLEGKINSIVLGKRYGVEARHIRRIWKGEQWKHITKNLRRYSKNDR